MKRVWIAIAFILIIFAVNFIYTHHMNTFTNNINSLVNQAISLADTNYEACGECIDNLLEEIDNSSLLLYSFSNRSAVDDIELSSKAAAEHYKLNSPENLKHELLMLTHRLKELNNSGKFCLENIL